MQKPPYKAKKPILTLEEFKSYMDGVFEKLNIPTVTPIGDGLVRIESKSMMMVCSEKVYEEATKRAAEELKTKYKNEQNG
jgi:hypothetical protein